MGAELKVPGLYVVDSDYLDGVQKTPFKYSKVAAVALASGEVVYVPSTIADGCNPDDLKRLGVDMPDDFLADIANFIGHYMHGRQYNCHTYTGWMVNRSETINPLLSRDEIEYPDRPLRQREPGFVFAGGGDHSTVGFGNGMTIQVMTNNGNIGILTETQMPRVYGGIPGVRRRGVAWRVS